MRTLPPGDEGAAAEVKVNAFPSLCLETKFQEIWINMEATLPTQQRQQVLRRRNAAWCECLSRRVITFQSASLTKKRLETRTVKELKRQVIVMWKDLWRRRINPQDGCTNYYDRCISAWLRSATTCVIYSAHYCPSSDRESECSHRFQSFLNFLGKPPRHPSDRI